MKSNRRQTAAAILAGLGFLVMAAAQWGTIRHSVAPVPIANLGLPPEAVEPFRQFVASLPRLNVVGAASDADNQRRRVILDGQLLRAGGGQWPWHGPQETGDCAAQAIAGALEIDIALQAEADPDIEWRPIDRPAIYGGGRVTIGKNAIRGAGLVPAWGLQFVDQRGIVWADQEGFPPYTGARADDWGRRGVPAEWLTQAKEYAGLTYARCDSAADVCNAIASGHPVIFGSMNWGTNRIKLIEGRNVAFDTEDWPHAQICSGYDGTLANGERLFRFLNSWGPNAHKPRSTMPGDHPGGYYATWNTMDAIASEGMTFAISGTKGFRARPFVPDFSVIGAADHATAPPDEESATMFPLPADFRTPGLFAGLALLVAALALYLLSRKGNGLRHAVGAVCGVAMLFSAMSAQAEEEPDWGRLTRAAQLTPPAMASDAPPVRIPWDRLITAAQIVRPERLAPDTKTPPADVCPCGCQAAGCKCTTSSKRPAPSNPTPGTDATKTTAPALKLFSYPGCGPCQTLRDNLQKMGVPYQEISEPGPAHTWQLYPVLTLGNKPPLVGAQPPATISAWLK